MIVFVLLHEAQHIDDDRHHWDVCKPIGCDRGLVPLRSLGNLTNTHICWCGIPTRMRAEALRASLDHSPCLLSSVGVVPGSYLDLTGHHILSEPIVTSLSSSCLLFFSIPSSYVHLPEPFGHPARASDQAVNDLRGICKLLEGAFRCHKLVYQPLIMIESHTECLTSRRVRSSG